MGGAGSIASGRAIPGPETDPATAMIASPLLRADGPPATGFGLDVPARSGAGAGEASAISPPGGDRAPPGPGQSGLQAPREPGSLAPVGQGQGPLPSAAGQGAASPAGAIPPGRKAAAGPGEATHSRPSEAPDAPAVGPTPARTGDNQAVPQPSAEALSGPGAAGLQAAGGGVEAALAGDSSLRQSGISQSGPSLAGSPAPHHTPPVAQQVVVALASGPDGPVELRLDPEELGSVRLSLLPSDGAVTVVVAAERAETMELLRRQADVLARELRASGFGEVTLRFDGGQNAGGEGSTGFGRGQDGQAGAAPPADPAASPSAPEARASLAPLAAGQGLDLRL